MEQPGLDDAVAALRALRAQDTAEMRLLIDALPNGDPEMDPLEYITDDSVVPQIYLPATHFLVPSEDGPDADLMASSGDSADPSTASPPDSGSGRDGEASE